MSKRAVARHPLSSLDLNVRSKKPQNRDKRPAVQEPSKAYPFSTLPLEIIVEIFIHCISSNPDDRPRLACTPSVLLRVCKTWRDIAIAAPRLWTRLTIFAPGRFFYNPGDVEQFVDAWVKRAKALPVSLEFTGFDAKDRDSIHATLSTHAPRLQSLTLKLPIRDFPADTLQLDFPELQRIALTVLWERPRSVERYIEAYPPYECFKSAPKLREVHLRTPTLPGLFVLPLEGLTKFTGEGLKAKQCLDFLRSVPSLVECSLEVERGRDSEIPLGDRVVMQHLRTLRLIKSFTDKDAERSEVVEILQLLNAPALERLELVCIPHLESFDREMAAFFSRASGSLQHFSFTSRADAYLEPSALEWFLQSPSLTHVEFVGPKNEFILSFLTRLHEVDFLPRLRTLRFLQSSFPAHTELVDALVSRSTIDGEQERAPLTVFELLWIDPSDEWNGLDPQLQKLADKGMQIRIASRKTGNSTK